MRKLLLLFLITLLAGCGYQLVGHGNGSGAIPADVKTLTLTVRGSSDRQIESMLRQQLKSERYVLIEASNVVDRQTHATLQVAISNLVFRPSAFDAAGVETEYRMVFSGSISIERQDEVIWKSGKVSVDGDVYVAGGPTSIEASRQRLYDDLRKQWIRDAMGRLRSGF